MTQEEKNRLLVQELCARYPYDVICKTSGDGVSLDLRLGLSGLSQFMYGRIDLKPYLRPMSSMTKEEFEEYEKANDLDTYDSHKALKAGLKGEKYISAWYHGVDWLNANHFDYRGLIQMGLALEAPEDMYLTPKQRELLNDITKEI